MQAASSQVNGEFNRILDQAHVDRHVRIPGIDIRTYPEALPQAVDNSVLDLQHGEVAVLEKACLYAAVDPETRFAVQVILPLQCAGPAV